MTDGYRRLAIAILHQGCLDALGKGTEATAQDVVQARQWLISEGADLADWLEVAHPDTVRQWAANLPALAQPALL